MNENEKMRVDTSIFEGDDKSITNLNSLQENTPPFYISQAQEFDLRNKSLTLVPSPVIFECRSFNDFVSQLMIPNTVMELARKSSSIKLSPREIEGIRKSLNNGKLRTILDTKYAEDQSHPPYIRVACTTDEIGSPVILEIWPGQHYSPIHSHGETTGIIYCLAGILDVMLYDKLDWNANKLGLLTLGQGECAWLNDKYFPVHKVFSPMPKGTFAASLHAYLNKEELPLLQLESRDIFDFVDEKEPHNLGHFKTHSDLTWSELLIEINIQAHEY